MVSHDLMAITPCFAFLIFISDEHMLFLLTFLKVCIFTDLWRTEILGPRPSTNEQVLQLEEASAAVVFEPDDRCYPLLLVRPDAKTGHEVSSSCWESRNTHPTWPSCTVSIFPESVSSCECHVLPLGTKKNKSEDNSQIIQTQFNARWKCLLGKCPPRCSQPTSLVALPLARVTSYTVACLQRSQ